MQLVFQGQMVEELGRMAHYAETSKKAQCKYNSADFHMIFNRASLYPFKQ